MVSEELGAAELQTALQSNDARQRASAVERARPDGDSIRVLAVALRDPDVEVRMSTISVLASSRAGGALAAVVEAASEDPSPRVRAAAVTAIAVLVRSTGGDSLTP